MPVTINREIDLPDTELAWRFSRSSGPGGQGVNTTDSRVELSFDLVRSKSLPESLRQRAQARLASRLHGGVLTISVSDERSQVRNRAIAQQRLAQLLREAIAAPPPRRRATKPSRNSVRRRLDAKKRRGETKRLRNRID